MEYVNVEVNWNYFDIKDYSMVENVNVEPSWKHFDVKDYNLINDIIVHGSADKKSLKHIGASDKQTYFFPTSKVPPKSDVDVAERMLTGFLKISDNHQEVKISLPPDWSNSPLNDNNWMFIFHSLRWLEPAINAYLITNDEKYIEFINSIIESWIEENTVGNEKSRFAWNDHATSYRLRLFTYYWNIYKQTNTFDKNSEFNQKFILSVYQHCLYHNDPNNYRIKSNHSLEMIGAILAAANTFKDDFYNADAFFETGIQLLEKYLTLNFSQKGYHLEQSPGYHWYVLERLLLIKGYLESNGVKLKRIENTIDAAWKANFMLLKPDKTFPTMGDTSRMDIGQKMKLLEEKGIILPEVNSNLPSFDVDETSGYSIFRSDDALAVFKCNNFKGPHFHNDHLSFTIFAYNTDWFVDPGYYSYNEKDPFRVYFRSGLSHSGVVVNGKGSNATEKKTDIQVGFNQEWVRSGRLFEGGSHERTFHKINNDNFFIEDKIQLEQGGEIEQLFQIHPSIRIHKISKGMIELENEEGVICRITQLHTIGNWKVVKGQETPYIQGWYTEKFGKKTPTYTLKYVVKGTKEVRLKTSIRFIQP